MDIYYSPSTPGFFSAVIYRKEQMPSDVVPITPEQHQALMLGESLGKVIGIDGNGVPVLLDPVVLPVDTAVRERDWRDAELASVMWLRERHRDQLEVSSPTTLSAEQFGELLTYIQALRDWPQSADFPDSLLRPVPPSWVDEIVQ